MTDTPARPRPKSLRPLCLCLCLLAPVAAPAFARGAQKDARARKAAPQKAEPRKAKAPPAAAQRPEARPASPGLLVRWQGQPGVNRYRLQLAADEKFEDIVFDRAVEGREYVVRDLPPGNYFWRVASAAAETSMSYSRPVAVTVDGSAANVSEAAGVFQPDESAGWRTATGEVTRLVQAKLRQGTSVDLVGVGADGRVFALDGDKGTSLWSARYAAAAGAPATTVPAFTPLAVEFGLGLNDVVVASEGGVRSLRGDTGGEEWRAALEGRAVSGAVADLDGDRLPEVVVVTSNPDNLYVLAHDTGRVKVRERLEAGAVGAPYVLEAGGGRSLALALKNSKLEIRGADGRVVREEKLEGEVTTAPLVVTRGEIMVLVVGTDRGLAALNVPELRLLGRIVAADDAVHGVLSAADVDKDGLAEIVMVTKRGRVALVSTTDGNVRWFAEGATDASSAAFADLNGDGVLDVIVPGGPAFALGFNGRDGSLLMRVDEGARTAAGKADASPRALIVAPTPKGPGLLVGSDPARVGLRAVELPKGDGRSALN